MKNIKLWMDGELKAKAEELAYQQRRRVSDVVREVVDDYLEHGADAQLAAVDVPSQELKLSVKVDETKWAQARDKADRAGVSIGSIARRGLAARTEKVTLP